MKVICLSLLTGLCLSWAGSASAQCQAGIPAAGNPQCIPPSAWPQNAQPSQAATTEPRWQLTWGAIAIDLSTGDVGTSVGKPTRKKAEREALARCAKHGASECKKLLFAYENQCAVVAWPDVPGQGTNVITQGGPSIEIASGLALRSCEGDSGTGRGCRIIYSECTEPVLIH